MSSSSSPVNHTSLTEQQTAQLIQQLQAAEQHSQQMRAEINHLRSVAAQAQLQASSSSSSSSSSPPVQGGGNVYIKARAPSEFSGQTGNNANQWLIEMERYFAVTNVQLDQPKSVLLASTYLKDAASVWYTSKYPTSADTPDTWSAFKEEFINRFRPFAAERLARVQLRELRQHRTVSAYSESFLKIVQHIPTMHKADQIDAYLHGLQAHISAEVDRCEPESLSEAMDIAQKEEIRQQSKKGQRLPFYSPHQRRNIAPHYNMAPAVNPNMMDLTNLNFIHGAPNSFPSSNPPSSAGGVFNLPPPTYSQFLNAMGVNENNSSPDQQSKHQQLYSDYLHAMTAHQLSAMHQRPSAGYRNNLPRRPPSVRAPEMSKEEYDRCVKLGLCFGCKQTGHLNRGCPVLQQQQPLNSMTR